MSSTDMHPPPGLGHEMGNIERLLTEHGGTVSCDIFLNTIGGRYWKRFLTPLDVHPRFVLEDLCAVFGFKDLIVPPSERSDDFLIFLNCLLIILAENGEMTAKEIEVAWSTYAKDSKFEDIFPDLADFLKNQNCQHLECLLGNLWEVKVSEGLYFSLVDAAKPSQLRCPDGRSPDNMMMSPMMIFEDLAPKPTSCTRMRAPPGLCSDDEGGPPSLPALLPPLPPPASSSALNLDDQGVLYNVVNNQKKRVSFCDLKNSACCSPTTTTTNKNNIGGEQSSLVVEKNNLPVASSLDEQINDSDQPPTKGCLKKSAWDQMILETPDHQPIVPMMGDDDFALVGGDHYDHGTIGAPGGTPSAAKSVFFPQQYNKNNLLAKGGGGAPHSSKGKKPAVVHHYARGNNKGGAKMNSKFHQQNNSSTKFHSSTGGKGGNIPWEYHHHQDNWRGGAVDFVEQMKKQQHHQHGSSWGCQQEIFGGCDFDVLSNSWVGDHSSAASSPVDPNRVMEILQQRSAHELVHGPASFYVPPPAGTSNNLYHQPPTTSTAAAPMHQSIGGGVGNFYGPFLHHPFAGGASLLDPPSSMLSASGYPAAYHTAGQYFGGGPSHHHPAATYFPGTTTLDPEYNNSAAYQAVWPTKHHHPYYYHHGLTSSTGGGVIPGYNNTTGLLLGGGGDATKKCCDDGFVTTKTADSDLQEAIKAAYVKSSCRSTSNDAMMKYVTPDGKKSVSSAEKSTTERVAASHQSSRSSDEVTPESRLHCLQNNSEPNNVEGPNKQFVDMSDVVARLQTDDVYTPVKEDCVKTVFTPSPRGAAPCPPRPTPCFSPEPMKGVRVPNVASLEMQSLKEAVLEYFKVQNTKTATMDQLAFDTKVNHIWKNIGRIPLWKLLKMFPGEMQQQQQANSVWLVSIL